MSNALGSPVARLPLLAALLGATIVAGCGDDSGGGAGGSGSASTGVTGSSGTDAAGTGGAGGGAPLECPSTVIATWERDGVAKQSSTTVGTFFTELWNFNLVDCNDDDVVQFKFLTTPVEPTTFDLRNKLPPANDEPGVLYADGETGGGFYTDPDHGGQLVITDVDPDAMTFSGTFEFTAAGGDYDGPNGETLTVTNGVLIDVPFSIAEE